MRGTYKLDNKQHLLTKLPTNNYFYVNFSLGYNQRACEAEGTECVILRLIDFTSVNFSCLICFYIFLYSNIIKTITNVYSYSTYLFIPNYTFTSHFNYPRVMVLLLAWSGYTGNSCMDSLNFKPSHLNGILKYFCIYGIDWGFSVPTFFNLLGIYARENVYFDRTVWFTFWSSHIHCCKISWYNVCVVQCFIQMELLFIDYTFCKV